MKLRQEIEQLTPRLRRFAHGLAVARPSVSPEAGDDLVHEALLRALKFEEPVRGLSTLHWLYAIIVGLNRQNARIAQTTRSKTLQHTRESQGSLARQANLQGQQSRHTSVSSDADSQAHHALALLDMEEREILLLVVVEGVSHAHAATILGLPQPTLLVRLARARSKFKLNPNQNHQMATRSASHLRLIK